jgi:hypothetical protein
MDESAHARGPREAAAGPGPNGAPKPHLPEGCAPRPPLRVVTIRMPSCLKQSAWLASECSVAWDALAARPSRAAPLSLQARNAADEPHLSRLPPRETGPRVVNRYLSATALTPAKLPTLQLVTPRKRPVLVRMGPIRRTGVAAHWARHLGRSRPGNGQAQGHDHSAQLGAGLDASSSRATALDERGSTLKPSASPQPAVAA